MHLFGREMEKLNMKTTSLDKDFIFSCTSDSNYIDYVYSLASSIKKNCFNIPLHIRLVNIHDNDKQIISAIIKERNNNSLIEFDDVSLSNERKYFRSKDQLLYGKSVDEVLEVKKESSSFKNVKNNYFLMSEQQCYTSNTRFRNIKKLLNEGYNYVMYIDADTIVRKNLYDLKDVLISFDITCNINECERYSNNKCWELSFLGIKNSNRIKSFIDQCMNLTESDLYDWDSDQNSIEEIYRNNFQDLIVNNKIKQIEDIGQLHNKEHLNDSYIWAGSGFNKLKNNKFIKELEKYYGKY